MSLSGLRLGISHFYLLILTDKSLSYFRNVFVTSIGLPSHHTVPVAWVFLISDDAKVHKPIIHESCPCFTACSCRQLHDVNARYITQSIPQSCSLQVRQYINRFVEIETQGKVIERWYSQELFLFGCFAWRRYIAVCTFEYRILLNTKRTTCHSWCSILLNTKRSTCHSWCRRMRRKLYTRTVFGIEKAVAAWKS